MAKHPELYAVITGDVVSSSQLNNEERQALLAQLKSTFKMIDQLFFQPVMAAPFEIYRGDSFQGVLKQPQHALRVNLLIRARLRNLFAIPVKKAWDARMAIGIGGIAYFSRKGTEGDGVAYRLSGPVLDDMKGETRLAISTSEEDINKEFAVASALADSIISKWSVAKAEVIEEVLKGKKQNEIAKTLNITQGAVNQRLKGAGWHGLKKFLDRYAEIVASEKLREK